MNELFNRLTAWLAPILCFTAEEAWQSRINDVENSVHLRSYEKVPEWWHNLAIDEKWTTIRQVRQVVMSALEKARNDGTIGASLQAAPKVYVKASIQLAFSDEDVASLFITSDASILTTVPPDGAFRLDSVADVAVGIKRAPGAKCARCWKITPEVINEQDICGRCQNVVATLV
jgi:isoleucyl-tRNA synthetase